MTSQLFDEYHILNTIIEQDKQVSSFKYALLRGTIEKKYLSDGYNIGVNDWESAGQTIMFLHIHLISRYKGDMDDPQGEVREVISEKQKYSPLTRTPRSDVG